MKQTIMLISFVVQLFFTAKAQKNGYDGYPVYQGKDLGLQWSPRQSIFKVWSPSATEMELRIYTDAETATPEKIIPLVLGKNGVWAAKVSGNLLGKLYTFSALQQDRWASEVPDPYAKAVGTNGKRAMVVDMAKTHPQGWGSDKAPVLKNPTDAIVYELHVRDASIAANSGIRQKGLFLGTYRKGHTECSGLVYRARPFERIGHYPCAFVCPASITIR